MAGSVKAPFDTTDFSFYLVAAQASGAGVLAINTLGGTNTAVKQAVEFGLERQMTMVLATPKSRDVVAMRLAAAGQLVVTSFYEDVTPAARPWSDRFMTRSKNIPTEIQAGVCSAVRHMLQAEGH